MNTNNQVIYEADNITYTAIPLEQKQAPGRYKNFNHHPVTIWKVTTATTVTTVAARTHDDIRKFRIQ